VLENELAEHLAATQDMTKAEAKNYIHAIFAVIGDAAAKVDETALAGFGKFSGKEDTGTRRTQSPHRRADNHQGRQQHRLPARQGAQGQAERRALAVTRQWVKKIRTAADRSNLWGPISLPV